MTGHEIIADVMKRHMVGRVDFFGISTALHLVKARRAAIKRLHDDGFKVPMIAKVIRRDRSTVRYWLRPDYRARRMKYDTTKREVLRNAVAPSTMRTPMSYQVSP